MSPHPSRVWLEIKDMAGLTNVVANHLSHLSIESTLSEELPVDDSFPDEQLLFISQQAAPWHADMVNFKVCGMLPPG